MTIPAFNVYWRQVSASATLTKTMVSTKAGKLPVYIAVITDKKGEQNQFAVSWNGSEMVEAIAHLEKLL